MNGTFALPSPLAVTFSKSAWSAPVSNDAVTITFKQHVDATDALRTGAYSKTLTFTLSTTTPWNEMSRLESRGGSCSYRQRIGRGLESPWRHRRGLL